jgi:hypothetical protein
VVREQHARAPPPLLRPEQRSGDRHPYDRALSGKRQQVEQRPQLQPPIAASARI